MLMTKLQMNVSHTWQQFRYRYLNHLVHASGSEASPYGIGESLRRLDVATADLLRLGVLGLHESAGAGGLRTSSCYCHSELFCKTEENLSHEKSVAAQR